MTPLEAATADIDPPPHSAAELMKQSPINDVLSVILRTGVYVSTAILLAGLLLYLHRVPNTASLISGVLRGAKTPPHVPSDLSQVAAGVARLDPPSLIELGLLVLLATPVIRVAVSILIFAHEHDWLYTVLTVLVLALLLFSIFFLSTLKAL